MDIEDIGREAQIHWNDPPLAKADKLGEAALANKAYSKVTRRLREVEPSASVVFTKKLNK